MRTKVILNWNANYNCIACETDDGDAFIFVTFANSNTSQSRKGHRGEIQHLESDFGETIRKITKRF